MRLFAAAVLAGALWGCDARGPAAPPAAPKIAGPSTTATVKIDDV